MRSIRTDLATEARSRVPEGQKGVYSEEVREGDITLTRVNVEDAAGAKAIGMPVGSYITIDMDDLRWREEEEKERFRVIAANELRSLCAGLTKGTVLVVGLGNREVTPDSLGPKLCSKLFVTRHIKAQLPDAIDKNAATVCAIAPGVLGVTGLETGEVVEGLVRMISPSLVIAVDTLAARSTARIGTSLQFNDVGIAPGSGLGNKRRAIDSTTLGVPVIGMGMPLVTYASTIAGDLIESALEDDSKADELIHALMREEGADYIVTPKEIDLLADECASICAKILDAALHDGTVM